MLGRLREICHSPLVCTSNTHKNPYVEGLHPFNVLGIGNCRSYPMGIAPRKFTKLLNRTLSFEQVCRQTPLLTNCSDAYMDHMRVLPSICANVEGWKTNPCPSPQCLVYGSLRSLLTLRLRRSRDEFRNQLPQRLHRLIHDKNLFVKRDDRV